MSMSVQVHELQDRFARSVSTLDVLARPATLARATDCLVDWFGVAIASSDAPVVALLGTGGDVPEPAAGGVPMLGSRARAEPMWAARVNGTAGHAQDFDDTHASSLVHVSSAVLAALLSAASAEDLDGRELLSAYVVGIWVCEVLAPGAGRRLLRVGLHPTATVGAIAAAAAVSRAFGMDAERCATALGLAASGSYGTLANFGTMAKPLQAGTAAANGWLAASLARRGVTAGRWGGRRLDNAGPVLRTLLGDDVIDRIWSDLAEEDPDGERALAAVRNVAHKPYAACLLTHSAIGAAIGLSSRLPLGAPGASIRSVTVRASEETIAAAGVLRPTTGYEAKFSLPYCVATGLTAGAVPVQAFADDFGRDEASLALAERVLLERDDRLEGFAVDLLVELVDGTRLSAHPTSARGQPPEPLTSGEIDDKFHQNIARVCAPGTAIEVHTLLRGWPTAPSSRAVIEQLWDRLDTATGHGRGRHP
jgi:2-methylcitrate dehydratase PrpD